MLLSYQVLIIAAGSTNGSTELDIVSATRQAMQPKTQEIYQTPQFIGTTLHVNNDFRGKEKYFSASDPTRDTMVTETSSLCIMCRAYTEPLYYLFLCCSILFSHYLGWLGFF